MKHVTPMGLQFAIIDRAFRRKVDEKVQKLDLTVVQLRVLGELNIREAAGNVEINQRDLERALHVTHPTMTELIKRLEKKGFVQCATSAIDRRYKKISSTARANALHMELSVEDDQVLCELCGDLTEEQIQLFKVVMEKMLDHVTHDT